jgi:putative PEP-CTERM system TPR-repeat lipoprotein
MRKLLGSIAILSVCAALVAGCGDDSPASLVASAQDFIKKQDYKSAEIQLKTALQKDPAQAEARYLLATVMMRIGDYASAEKEFRRALEYKYSPDAVYPQLARAVFRQGNVDLTRKGVGEFREVKLSDAGAQAALKSEIGSAYVALGQIKDARAAFDEALAAKPDDPAARVGAARLKAAELGLDGIMKVVEEVLAVSPGLIEALSLKAEVQVARGETDAAVATLREVVKAEPRDGGARAAIASLLIGKRKFDEAAAEIAALRKTLPQDVRGRYLEGLLAFRRGEPAKAKDPILQVLRALPDHAPTLLLAGAIEFQLGQFIAAEEHLRKVVARVPQHSYARSLLALTQLRLGQPAKAEETIAPALARAPKDPHVLRVAGYVAIANNDAKKATEYYERAAAAAKDDPPTRIRLGTLRLVTGDTEGAMRELEAASEMDPGALQADLGIIAALISKKEIDKALAVADRLVEKQPMNAVPENVRGLVYLAKGDRKRARASFEKALELQFDFLPAAANLARLDIADKQPEAARKRFETIAAKSPKNEQVLLALAEAQAATGAPLNEVIATVDRAVSANPTSSRARLAQISLQLRNNNAKAALAAAQSAAAALPDNPPILQALGRAQIAAGEPNQAVATFSKLATLMPQSHVPLLLLARAHAAKKDFEAATQTLQKALALQPERLDVHRDAIAAYIAAGRPEEALADAKAVQKARPKQAIGFMFEGEVYAAQKKYGEAARAYAEALKRQPAPVLVLRQAGLLELAGRKSDADAVLARWMRENPKDSLVRIHGADRNLLRKDYKAAAAGYRQVLEDEPNNAVALNNLAWTLHQLNDPAALGYAEKAANLAPRDPAVVDTLGWILVERGETKRGTEMLGQASKAAPNAHVIRMHYAKALIKSGDKAAARKELEVIANAAGENPLKTEAGALLKQL